MKKLFQCLTVAALMTVSSSVVAQECAPPMFASKATFAPPQYVLDWINTYQGWFGVEPVSETNNWRVGYWYPQPCSNGLWYVVVSYDGGQTMFYPSPLFHGHTIESNLPVAERYYFWYVADRPLTWLLTFWRN